MQADQITLFELLIYSRSFAILQNFERTPKHLTVVTRQTTVAWLRKGKINFNTRSDALQINHIWQKHGQSRCGAEMGEFWHLRCATAGVFTIQGSLEGWLAEHLGRICCVGEGRSVSGRFFGCGKFGVGPILCRADFLLLLRLCSVTCI